MSKLDELRESTDRIMKKACAVRLGELIGEMYCTINEIPTSRPLHHHLEISNHPYADIIEWQYTLGVNLPNQRWSFTTFKQCNPLEFAKRMFDIEAGDDVKYYTPGFIMGYRSIVHSVYETDPDEYEQMLLLQLKITRKVEKICNSTQN